MRTAGPLARLVATLTAAATLASCTGDGTTLGPDGVPLGPPVVIVSPSEFVLSMIEATNSSVAIGIASAGGLPLRVEGVTATSSLLVPDFAGPRDLAAGAEVTVTTAITAPAALLSPLEAALEVRTNDPRTPVVVVPVRVVATVEPVPGIDVSADSLTVRVAPERSGVRTITVRSTGTGDLDILSITGTASFLVPGIDHAIVAPGDSVDIVVTADAAGVPVGQHVAAIEIHSNDADEPLVSVPVLLSIEAPFPATFTEIQNRVFTPYCAFIAGCHTFETVAGELVLEDGFSYGQLVGIKSMEVGGLYRVTPGNATDSYLQIKIGPFDPRRVGFAMPPLPYPPLNDSLVAVVRKWIEEGAPDD